MNDHIVNRHTVFILGEYQSDGSLFTRVVEENRTFLAERKPIQVLDATLNRIGFNFEGAIKGARSILGKRNKPPIILNPTLGICMFPIKSPHKDDCIWFNPNHIFKTNEIGRQTEVVFSNGHSIKVDLKVTAFNNKVQMADQLIKITTKNASNPTTHYLRPKKGYEITKEKNGKYNFDIFEKEYEYEGEKV
ncbi:competence protein ComK [Cytobacillus purgationiresistens]|uniref:Competence transcription factor ComK n=1 Tax=Cytobacillus purgationiresistens TaxID=863449 RepID=A0ABU0AGI2_9BACI|nr:competence protein ComK [Cytobacillus purgationiresistens]MDQ0269195.1 competence transcription factor ComK [Cytobacillus purgationiresistens]